MIQSHLVWEEQWKSYAVIALPQAPEKPRTENLQFSSNVRQTVESRLWLRWLHTKVFLTKTWSSVRCNVATSLCDIITYLHSKCPYCGVFYIFIYTSTYVYRTTIFFLHFSFWHLKCLLLDCHEYHHEDIHTYTPRCSWHELVVWMPGYYYV